MLNTCKVRRNTRTREIDQVVIDRPFTDERANVIYNYYRSIGIPIHLGKEAMSEELLRRGYNLDFQIIGEQGVSNLTDSVQRIVSLNNAKKLKEQGKSDKDIWIATGWQFDIVDQKWKTEIADEIINPLLDLEEVQTKIQEFQGQDITIPLNIIYSAQVFEAYPQLNDIQLIFSNRLEGLAATAKGEDFIVLNPNTTLEELQKTLLHELHHKISEYEGFSEGASFNRIYSEYLSDFIGYGGTRVLTESLHQEILTRANRDYFYSNGEFGARTTEDRVGLSTEERRLTPLFDDVDEDSRRYITNVLPTLQNPLDFLSTSKGEIYGFVTPEGEMFLDPDIAGVNTLIHEGAHIQYKVLKTAAERGDVKAQAILNKIQELTAPAVETIFNAKKAQERSLDSMTSVGMKAYEEVIRNIPNLTEEQVKATAELLQTITENAAQRAGVTVEEYLKNRRSIYTEKPLSNARAVQLMNVEFSNHSNEQYNVLNQPNQNLKGLANHPQIVKLGLDINNNEEAWIARYATKTEEGKRLLGSLGKNPTVEQLKTALEEQFKTYGDKIKGGNEFYITEISDAYIDAQIEKSRAESNSENIYMWEDVKRNKQRYINEQQTLQRQNLSSLYDYYNNAIEYPLAMKLMILDAITKHDYRYDKDKDKIGRSKRGNNTISPHILPNSLFMNKVIEHPLSDKNIIHDYFYEAINFKGEKINLQDYKENVHKVDDNGTWYHFTQNRPQDEELFYKMSALSAEYPGAWCTGASIDTARNYLKNGDLYIFYDNRINNPSIQLHVQNSTAIEIGGLEAGQGIRPEDVEVIDKFKKDSPEINLSDIEDYNRYSRLLLRWQKSDKDVQALSREDSKFLLQAKPYYKDSTGNLEKFKESLTKKDYAYINNTTEDNVFDTLTNDNISELRENAVILGHVSFNTLELPQNFTIPKGATFNGGVSFSEATLPQDFIIQEGVTFNGIVDFQEADLTEGFTIQEGVTFNEYVNFSKTTLPEGFTILKGITFNGQVSFYKAVLPQNFTISEGVTFNRYVDFERATLPQGFTIPKGVTFNGKVYFSETILPQGFTIQEGVTFNGDVDFERARLSEGFTIQEGVTFNGFVSFYEAILPEGLNISEDSNSFTITYPDGNSITHRKNQKVGEVLQQDNRGVIVQRGETSLTIFNRNSDITTIIHEKAHEYEHTLTPEEVKVLEEWSGHKQGTVEFSEAFAKGAEKVLYDGTFANEQVENIFTKFARWFQEVIQQAIEYFSDINEMNPEVLSIYRNMMTRFDGVIETSVDMQTRKKGNTRKLVVFTKRHLEKGNLQKAKEALENYTGRTLPLSPTFEKLESIVTEIENGEELDNLPYNIIEEDYGVSEKDIREVFDLYSKKYDKEVTINKTNISGVDFQIERNQTSSIFDSEGNLNIEELNRILENNLITTNLTENEKEGLQRASEYAMGIAIIGREVENIRGSKGNAWVEETTRRAIEEYSRGNQKIWTLEEIEQDYEQVNEGSESVVYKSKDNTHVIKKLNTSKSDFNFFDYVFDRIVIHNTLFTDTSYEIIGLTEEGDLILRQPFYEGPNLGELVFEGELESYEEALDIIDKEVRLKFNVQREVDGFYFVDDYVLTDINPFNVIQTSEGRFIIDSITFLQKDKREPFFLEIEQDLDFQIIGEQGAQRVQEYVDSLSKAKELEQEGIPYDQIEIQTGWYKYEGQWRTIPSEVLQNFKIEKYETNTILPLREVLVDENPLFEFYPELQEISVVFVEEGKPDTPQNLPKGFENSEGLYEEATKTIFLPTMVQDKRQTDTGLEYNLGHEVQHVISEIEGFPKVGDYYSVLKEAAELSSPAYNQRENETDEQYKERLIEEVFARALGDNAEQYLKDLGFTAQEAKTFLQKVQEFLAEIVDWLRGKKGLQDLSVDEINRLSIREFLDRSTTSMMLGEFKDPSQTAALTPNRDVQVYITPATVRSFNEETLRLKELTNEYNKVAQEISQGNLENQERFTILQNEILDTYQEHIQDKVSKIRGVNVNFNQPYLGSWKGGYEPSLNMTLSISPNADTGAISGLLFDIAENTSQDAFILEEISEKEGRIPLTEFDEAGMTHFPQIRVIFDKQLTVEEKSIVAQRLKSKGIIDFSIDGDYFIVSIIDFNSETYGQKEEFYDEKHAAITTLFTGEGEKIGTNKVKDIQEHIRKSRYVAARNAEDEQSQTREYDRSDLFEAQSPNINPQILGEQQSFFEDSDFDQNGNVRPEVIQEIEQEKAEIIRKAKEDGTWLKAPNGRDTNLNEDQWVTVRTKRFKKWFGDWINDPENASKVVDENGEPLVVYRGDNTEFTEFDRSKTKGARYGKLFNFTYDKSFAYQHGNLRSFFINSRNPLDIDNIENVEIDKLIEGVNKILGKPMDKLSEDIFREDPYKLIDTIIKSDKFITSLSYAGYTGVQELSYNGVQAVIDPNQIKSATDNVGTFSSETDNINFHISGEIGASDNRSSQTQGFFSDVVTGVSDRFKPNKPYQVEVQYTPKQQAFEEVYSKHRGNFDEHIATSIPRFRETQVQKGTAISAVISQIPGAKVLDIGGSEGSFVKSITEVSGAQSINLEPNPDMAESHRSTPVTGSEVVQEAFYEGFGDVQAYRPTDKFDVVHESMVFQFITSDRVNFVKEVVDNYLKEGGLFITEEKLKTGEQTYIENEIQKDTQHKSKYYDESQLKTKAEEILGGMNENQASAHEYLSLLKENFDYVGIYWNSGNFYGIVATNSKEKFNHFMQEVGDTTSEYSKHPVGEVTDEVIERIRQEEIEQPLTTDIQGVQVLEYQGSTLSYKQRVNPITNQPTNQIEIDLISVPQENRKQGHARELLRRITEIADARGQELYLFAAPRDRTTTTEGLIKLYKEFGFESISSFLPEEMVRPARRDSQRAEESLPPAETLLTVDLDGVQEYVPADKIITYYSEMGEINYKENSEGELVMLKTISATPQQEESITYKQLLSIPNLSKEQALEAYKNLYSTDYYDWKNKTNEC